MLDIGANVGEYSKRYARRVGESGSVIAVEPDPEIARQARERLAPYPWVTVMPVGVDKCLGHTTLYRDTERKRSSLWAANRLETLDEIQVECVTLDFLANMVPNLRAIKVDIQGAEARMLAGATETLQRTNLAWYVELWPMGLRHAGSSADEVCDIYEAHGWEPAGCSWAQIRAGIPNQSGHGAIDMLLKHKEAI